MMRVPPAPSFWSKTSLEGWDVARCCSMVILLAAALLALSGAPPDGADRVTAARELLGVPYRLGGRLRRDGDGIDCQGLVFYALEKVYRCGWRSYSVFPTRSVARAELGRPVSGLAPVSSDALPLETLAPGDIVMMVGFAQNPKEPAIAKLDGRPVWVWHVGMYTEAGRWIVGDHYAGKVVEVDLRTYLQAHADVYAGVFVTRLDRAPQLRRCRRHRPMRPPAR